MRTKTETAVEECRIRVFGTFAETGDSHCLQVESAMNAAVFLAKWTAEAEAMQRRGVMVNGTGLLAEVLADFKEVVASEQEAVLSLPEAAGRSGYSVEHLGRLVREGRIPNAGRKGSPRIRVADLPRKPATLVLTAPRRYDPHADARTLLSRQRGGSNG